MDKCKIILISVLVKVIAPHPSASVGKRKQNTERTQPIDGAKNDGGQLLQKPKPTQPTDSKNNEMSQVVEVITHENKKKWGSSYIIFHENSKSIKKRAIYFIIFTGGRSQGRKRKHNYKHK